MNRESQLPLLHAGHSQGLFAPTIRYHEGVFYVICTNVSYGGNYVVTADSPEGAWSEPHYLEGADGIDPSLFFDTDGRCYYIGTHPNPEGCRYDGDWYIWNQELDLTSWKLVGGHKNIWNGAMRGVHWPEGPHLYKKGEYYYIMHAEGGTGPEHAVSICRSKEIWGPYKNNFCNPILTHRHLGQAYPIKYVGHADLIETPAGEWFMTMLAVRPLEGYTTMGRETFLAKVTWENDWPVVNAGVGQLTDQVEVDLPQGLPEQDPDSYTSRCRRRNAVPGIDSLYLTPTSVTLEEQDSSSYVGIRQQHHAFRMETVPETQQLTDGCKAGLALIQSNENHLRLEVTDGLLQVVLCRQHWNIGQREMRFLWRKRGKAKHILTDQRSVLRQIRNHAIYGRVLKRIDA